MTKKYIAIISIVSMVLVGASSLVFAETAINGQYQVNVGGDTNSSGRQSGNTDNQGMPQKNLMMGSDNSMHSASGQQMVVQIGARGEALLRGTIDAVGTNSITVKSWGGDWMVNIATTTQLMPGSDMTQFKAGDFVGVQGQVNQTASWTIDAKLVRDWTAKQTQETTKDAVQQLMNSVTPRNWQGVASNVNASGNSFTLTINETAYTITLATGAKVVNQQYLAMNLADIKGGDTVRVYATLSGTTATAYVVRDISVGASNMPMMQENNK